MLHTKMCCDGNRMSFVRFYVNTKMYYVRTWVGLCLSPNSEQSEPGLELVFLQTELFEEGVTVLSPSYHPPTQDLPGLMSESSDLHRT